LNSIFGEGEISTENHPVYITITSFDPVKKIFSLTWSRGHDEHFDALNSTNNERYFISGNIMDNKFYAQQFLFYFPTNFGTFKVYNAFVSGTIDNALLEFPEIIISGNLVTKDLTIEHDIDDIYAQFVSQEVTSAVVLVKDIKKIYP